MSSERTQFGKLGIGRALLGILCIAIAIGGCAHKDRTQAEILSRFVKAKEKQARELNKEESQRWPGELADFFKAARAGQQNEISNRFAEISAKYRLFTKPVKTNGWDKFMMEMYPLGSRLKLFPTNYWPQLNGPIWQPVNETYCACRAFQEWDPDLLLLFATNIINSIPSNSIYLGGTDDGRFVVTALSQGYMASKPFFILTQNQLADPSYRKYMEHIYGKKLKLPTEDEVSQAFRDYMQDAQKRLTDGKLKEQEYVSISSNGAVNVSGRGAVMEINAKLAKFVFDTNSNQEFYIDQWWRMDWMYPHLEPHGLILRLNRTGVEKLDSNAVSDDRAYWSGMTERLTGLKIGEKTSLKEIDEYAEAVYLRNDLSQFKGDRRFAGNARAQQCFASLRMGIADVYDWRARNATDKTEQQQMRAEAELAFKQAFALCPGLWSIGWYEEMLQAQKREEEAKFLHEARAKFPSRQVLNTY